MRVFFFVIFVGQAGGFCIKRQHNDGILPKLFTVAILPTIVYFTDCNHCINNMYDDYTNWFIHTGDFMLLHVTDVLREQLVELITPTQKMKCGHEYDFSVL